MGRTTSKRLRYAKQGSPQGSTLGNTLGNCKAAGVLFHLSSQPSVRRTSAFSPFGSSTYVGHASEQVPRAHLHSTCLSCHQNVSCLPCHWQAPCPKHWPHSYLAEAAAPAAVAQMI